MPNEYDKLPYVHLEMEPEDDDDIEVVRPVVYDPNETPRRVQIPILPQNEAYPRPMAEAGTPPEHGQAPTNPVFPNMAQMGQPYPFMMPYPPAYPSIPYRYPYAATPFPEMAYPGAMHQKAPYPWTTYQGAAYQGAAWNSGTLAYRDEDVAADRKDDDLPRLRDEGEALRRKADPSLEDVPVSSDALPRYDAVYADHGPKLPAEAVDALYPHEGADSKRHYCIDAPYDAEGMRYPGFQEPGVPDRPQDTAYAPYQAQTQTGGQAQFREHSLSELDGLSQERKPKKRKKNTIIIEPSNMPSGGQTITTRTDNMNLQISVVPPDEPGRTQKPHQDAATRDVASTVTPVQSLPISPSAPASALSSNALYAYSSTEAGAKKKKAGKETFEEKAMRENAEKVQARAVGSYNAGLAGQPLSSNNPVEDSDMFSSPASSLVEGMKASYKSTRRKRRLAIILLVIAFLLLIAAVLFALAVNYGVILIEMGDGPMPTISLSGSLPWQGDDGIQARIASTSHLF